MYQTTTTCIAIDLGGTNLRAARVRNGQIEASLQEPCLANGTQNEVLEQIAQMITRLYQSPVERIGIAVPSIVDYKKGIVYHVQNIPSWTEVHLKDILEQRFNLETRVDNDVNCFVAAENVLGAGQAFRDFVGITLGTGIGAGIVINNEVYRGVHTGAGEIGCISYLDSIYEDYTSSQLFHKWHTTGQQEALKAAQGDQAALQKWQELGFHLGKLLQVILYAYNPEAIIIGGGISLSHPLFEQSMYESMHEKFLFPKESQAVQIIFSKLKDCNILGAAQL